MLTFQSNNNLFTVTLQADAYPDANTSSVYTKSRTMLRVRRYDNARLSLVHISFVWTGVTKHVTYYTNPQGILEITLKDFINGAWLDGYHLAGFGVDVMEIDHTAVDSWAQILYIYEGISYYDTNPPRNKDCQQIFGAYSSRYIMPPNVILDPVQLQGQSPAAGVIVESNYQQIDVKNWIWSQLVNGAWSEITPTGARENQLEIAYNAETLRLQSLDGTITKTWPLAKADYCADLVCIRWKSMTGATRQHFFNVVSFAKGVDNAVSLVSPSDGYNVTKNVYNSVVCRLDGLTPYGYWYYMDLLQSSDIHAIMTPSSGLWSTQIESENTRAHVEIDEMVSPNGNGFFTFEFTLKMVHYDTI